MLLDTDRDKNIDFLGIKVSIFCCTYIAVGHRIQGGGPAPLQLKYAVVHMDPTDIFSPPLLGVMGGYPSSR